MRVALSIFYVLLIAAAGELLVGQFAPSFYDHVVRMDGTSGAYAYVPNIQGAFRDQESGLLQRLQTNSQGFRDSERPWTRLPGVSDIVVAGNSFVDARQVQLEKRFTSRLESELSRAGRETRVFNLGIHGQNIVNHVDLALYAEETLAPAMAVVVLDLPADFAGFTSQTTYRHGRRIVYDAGSDPVSRSEQELNSWESKVRSIRSMLRRLWLVRIAQSTEAQISLWLANFGQRRAANDPMACPAALRIGSPTADASFRLAKALIDDLHQVLGKRLLIVLIPAEAQLSPTANEKDCDWTRSERWLQNLAERDGVAAVSLLSPLQAHRREVFFPGGHLTAAGHEIVAEALRERIEALLSASKDRAGQ